jgi:hypothetical protein
MSPAEGSVVSRLNSCSVDHKGVKPHPLSQLSAGEKNVMFSAVQPEHVISSSEGGQASQIIEMDHNQELDQEIILAPELLESALLNGESTVETALSNISPLNNSSSRQAIPLKTRPLIIHYDRLFSTYLQNVSQWVLKIGGLTFIIYNLRTTLLFIVIKFKLDWAVYSMLKLECLMSMLAWYWISVDEHIKQRIDGMLVSAVRKLLTLRIWPLKVRIWADQLEMEENVAESSF